MTTKTTNLTLNDHLSTPTPDAGNEDETAHPLTLSPSDVADYSPTIAHLVTQAPSDVPSAHLAALSPKQLVALNALIAGKSNQQAAAAAGVNRYTLTRWLSSPAFRAALNQELHELIRHTAMRSAYVTTLALDVLEDILHSDEHPTVKIQAARAVFHHRPPPPSLLHTSPYPETLAHQDHLATLTQKLIQDLNQ